MRLSAAQKGPNPSNGSTTDLVKRKTQVLQKYPLHPKRGSVEMIHLQPNCSKGSFPSGVGDSDPVALYCHPPLCRDRQSISHKARVDHVQPNIVLIHCETSPWFDPSYQRTHVQTLTHSRAHTHAHTHTRTHTHLHTCPNPHTQPCSHTRTHAHTLTFTPVQTLTHSRAHTHAHTHAHTSPSHLSKSSYTHAHTYTHTYTYLFCPSRRA